jgi:hypothetical protein
MTLFKKLHGLGVGSINRFISLSKTNFRNEGDGDGQIFHRRLKVDSLSGSKVKVQLFD